MGCRELIVACDDCVAAYSKNRMLVVGLMFVCCATKWLINNPLSAAARCESRAAILSGGITVSSASTMRAPACPR